MIFASHTTKRTDRERLVNEDLFSFTHPRKKLVKLLLLP